MLEAFPLILALQLQEKDFKTKIQHITEIFLWYYERADQSPKINVGI